MCRLLSTPRPGLRDFTPARVSLSATGHSIVTKEVLNFQLAHAQARDAVHKPFPLSAFVERLQAELVILASASIPILELRTNASNRADYLRRPDLGRTLHPDSVAQLQPASYDLAIIIADGLSALAVERHAIPLLAHLLPQLLALGWTVSPLALVEQGRVAIGDPIGRHLGASLSLVLIGERPGLSSPDSLGAYLTWRPHPDRTDADRNCLSNIRHGALSPESAAARLFWYLQAARARQITGIALKEDSLEIKDAAPSAESQLFEKSGISNRMAPDIQLETRQLGTSDLHITPIGFGAWAIGGGDWEFGWGSQQDEDSIRAIRHALDLGLNWIDTAAVYGLGHSEEVIAKALKNSAHKPYIFTKCSMRWKTAERKIYRSLKAESLREELENSLRRLQVEVIDLYQVHWPDPDSEIEEGIETLAKFKQEGKVRYIGVSNFSVAQLKRAQKIATITSQQPPYSILHPDVEKEILPFCRENNIGVINYSTMASGLLTGKMSAKRIAALPEDDWRRKNPDFKEPRLSRNLKIVELLREIGKPHNVEPGVVAIAWTLHHPAITAAIAGARRPEQVDGIIQAAAFRLSEEEFVRIQRFVAANPA